MKPLWKYIIIICNTKWEYGATSPACIIMLFCTDFSVTQHIYFMPSQIALDKSVEHFVVTL